MGHAEPPMIPSSARGKTILGEWLKDVAHRSERVFRGLFQQSTAVAIFFYAASDFANAETGLFDRGSFFLAYEATRRPFAPYGKALDLLRDGLSKAAR